MLARKTKFVVALCLALGVTGGVALSSGAPAPRNDLPAGFEPPSKADVTPVDDTRRVAATARDPHGGLPWGLELSRSESGGICQAVNRTQNGRLVVVEPDGGVRGRRAPETLECTKFAADAGPREHVDLGAVAQHGAVIFHGVADDEVDRVAIVTPAGEHRPVTLGRDREFIVAFAGDPEDPPRYDVRVRLKDGTTVSYF